MRAAFARVLLVVAVFAAGGALAGVVWEWVWTPPTGVVVEGRFLLDADGLRADFSGTALYVLVAAVTGLLLGVLVALRAAGRELLTLAAVVAGSVVAGWLMLQTGTALGPPDPRPLASSADHLGRLPDRLDVAGRSPYVAFPAGALAGLVVVFVGLGGRRDRGH